MTGWILAALALLGATAKRNEDPPLGGPLPPSPEPTPPGPGPGPGHDPLPELSGEELARHGRDQGSAEALATGLWWVTWAPIQMGPYTLYVSTDCLSVGSPPIRWSPTHLQAQQFADAAGALLPTPAIVDAIWAQATHHAAPRPTDAWRKGDGTMMSVDEWVKYAASVEKDYGPPPTGELTSPLGKDYVQVPELTARPTQCAIYGWTKMDGVFIQPVSLIHENTYADYSHTCRLVARQVKTSDGQALDLADLYLAGDPWVAPRGPTPPRHPRAPILEVS